MEEKRLISQFDDEDTRSCWHATLNCDTRTHRDKQRVKSSRELADWTPSQMHQPMVCRDHLAVCAVTQPDCAAAHTHEYLHMDTVSEATGWVRLAGRLRTRA